jgi:hypothetical protein
MTGIACYPVTIMGLSVEHELITAARIPVADGDEAATRYPYHNTSGDQLAVFVHERRPGGVHRLADVSTHPFP